MFARFQTIGIHGQTHGTAWLPPFEIGGNKNFIQTFRFRLLFDQTGPRHTQHLLDGVGFTTTLNHSCRLAQIFDTRIGAGTNKDFIHPDISHFLTSLQAHVLQGAADAFPFHRIVFLLGIRHAGVYRRHHFRRSSPGNLGFDV